MVRPHRPLRRRGAQGRSASAAYQRAATDVRIDGAASRLDSGRRVRRGLELWPGPKERSRPHCRVERFGLTPERFRAKWEPVRVKKTRQNEKLVWWFRSPHHLCRGFVMRTSEPKPHQTNRFASVLSIPKFEKWLPKILRTSESGH